MFQNQALYCIKLLGRGIRWGSNRSVGDGPEILSLGYIGFGLLLGAFVNFVESRNDITVAHRLNALATSDRQYYWCPNANRHQPPTTNRHQLPTTNRHQLPVANCQPPTTANRQLPTANRHQPWLSTWSARGLFWENWYRNSFFSPLRTALPPMHRTKIRHLPSTPKG